MRHFTYSLKNTDTLDKGTEMSILIMQLRRQSFTDLILSQVFIWDLRSVRRAKVFIQNSDGRIIVHLKMTTVKNRRCKNLLASESHLIPFQKCMGSYMNPWPVAANDIRSMADDDRASIPRPNRSNVCGWCPSLCTPVSCHTPSVRLKVLNCSSGWLETCPGPIPTCTYEKDSCTSMIRNEN